MQFLLRAAQLDDPSGPAAALTCETFAQALASPGAAEAAAKGAIVELQTLTSRTFPLETMSVLKCLAPLIEAVPASGITCDKYIEDADWTNALCKAVSIVSTKLGAADFKPEKVPPPLLVGVGGFGMVELAFLADWCGQPLSLFSNRECSASAHCHCPPSLPLSSVSSHISQSFSSPSSPPLGESLTR